MDRTKSFYKMKKLTNLVWPYFVMNFLDSNLSGSHISTLPKKKKKKEGREKRKEKQVGRRGKYKTGN